MSKLKVPITGTITDFDANLYKSDNIGIKGDPNDPVRLIDIDLGNVSWRLVSIDLVNEEAEIEITPSEIVSELKNGGNPDNEDDWITRATTTQEKLNTITAAEDKVKNKTKGELLALTGNMALKIKASTKIKLNAFKATL